MTDARTLSHPIALLLLLGALSLGTLSCGGGQGGGPGPDGAGQGLILVQFQQNGLDNVQLNTALEFVFSEAVDASSVNAASLQIREGPDFGTTVDGDFRVTGSTVYFEPRLPGLCGYSDAGLKPNTTYRLQLVGAPEEFSIRNTQGQPLEATLTLEFGTLSESDPELFRDQIAGTLPAVTSISPADHEAAVTVDEYNQVVVQFSETLEPCSISDSSVQLYMYETGDINTKVTGAPSGNESGFDPWDDQDIPNPETWGPGHNTVFPPQRIPVTLELVQTFHETMLYVTPLARVFPENALLVVELRSSIVDMGGSPLPYSRSSFTTENLPIRPGTWVVENEGETPYLSSESTAEINSARAPSKVMGVFQFAGDGDNGSGSLFPVCSPSSPGDNPPDCDNPRDEDDGVLDFYEPTSDSVLDTGSVLNECPNRADGSFAVVFEFASFIIPAGVTVTVRGVNPAIILVSGPVDIQGELIATGGNGGNGIGGTSSALPNGAPGGLGGPGGGDGGRSQNVFEGRTTPFFQPYGTPYSPLDPTQVGEDGWEGYGSPNYFSSPHTPFGGGEGNASAWHGALNPPYYQGSSCSAAGGGGGHGDIGGTGTASVSSQGGSILSAPARGAGGEAYGTVAMLLPSAGSGGGAAGYHGFPSYTGTYGAATSSGGAGGGGGGFIDITSDDNISVSGAIRVNGGRGGNGAKGSFCDMHASAGGGGGSGGGLRLITSRNLDVSGGTITALGGLPGSPGSPPT